MDWRLYRWSQLSVQEKRLLALCVAVYLLALAFLMGRQRQR